MDKKYLFIHVHIPKCGGSTFLNILQRNCTTPRTFYWDNPVIVHKHTAKEIKQTTETYPFLEAISSHQVSLDLPFNLETPEVIAISFVRDPVERFISSYYMHKNSPSTGKQKYPIAKELDLPEFAKWALIEGNMQPFIQGQSFYLTRMEGGSGLPEIRELIDRGKLLLFPLTRFNEACLLLEKQYPHFFKDCSHIKMNARKNKENDIPEETINIIRNNLPAWDDDLIKIADNFLDKTMSKYFESSESASKALNDFSNRCLKLEIYQHSKR